MKKTILVHCGLLESIALDESAQMLGAWRRNWRGFQVEKLLLETLTDDGGRSAFYRRAENERQRKS